MKGHDTAHCALKNCYLLFARPLIIENHWRGSGNSHTQRSSAFCSQCLYAINLCPLELDTLSSALMHINSYA